MRAGHFKLEVSIIITTHGCCCNAPPTTTATATATTTHLSLALISLDVGFRLLHILPPQLCIKQISSLFCKSTQNQGVNPLKIIKL